VDVVKVAGLLEPYPVFLHIFLDAFWLRGQATNTVPTLDYLHTRQVELYAEYDPSRLIYFLRSSTAYSVQKVISCCRSDQ
jgi:hypothetical protein